MDISTISRALDQIDGLLNDVGDRWDAPTPCADWSVKALADHLVNTTAQFAAMASGRPADFAADQPGHDDPPTEFRTSRDALLSALETNPGGAPEGMLAGELAVHTWDLATALGRGSSDLDPELAETGYAFMSTQLTDDRRGEAFAPQQPAPPDANAYERLAAFAGRTVSR